MPAPRRSAACSERSATCRPSRRAGGRSTTARISSRSDCLIYELVTGTRPFERATTAQSLAATIDADPAPIETLNPDVPAAPGRGRRALPRQGPGGALRIDARSGRAISRASSETQHRARRSRLPLDRDRLRARAVVDRGRCRARSRPRRRLAGWWRTPAGRRRRRARASADRGSSLHEASRRIPQQGYFAAGHDRGDPRPTLTGRRRCGS